MVLKGFVFVFFGCVLLCGAGQADTAHYYRFEAGADFLSDSSGNGLLLNGSASEWVLPGSAGRGVAFPKGFLDSTQNMSAAQFSGANDPPRWQLQPLLDVFTVEVLVHFDTLSGDFGVFVVADTAGVPNSGWVVDVRRDGFGGSQLNEFGLTARLSNGDIFGAFSGFVLKTSTDYYIAVAYDRPANTIIFWVKNLTTGDELQRSSVTQNLPALQTSNLLQVGGISGAGQVDGLIDELRISSRALSESELLVNNIDIDVDDDGITNSDDNCIFNANADQSDTNSDGIGNVCDADIEPIPGDCLVNFADLGGIKEVFFTTSSSPRWNPDADFDGNDLINFADLGRMKELYLEPPGLSGLPNDCE